MTIKASFENLEKNAEPDLETFPAISPELIEKLEKIYPNCCPHKGWSDREILVQKSERVIAYHPASNYPLYPL